MCQVRKNSASFLNKDTLATTVLQVWKMPDRRVAVWRSSWLSLVHVQTHRERSSTDPIPSRMDKGEPNHEMPESSFLYGAHVVPVPLPLLFRPGTADRDS